MGRAEVRDADRARFPRAWTSTSARHWFSRCVGRSGRAGRWSTSDRLKQRSFETKEGEKRTVIELGVNDIGPSGDHPMAQASRSGTAPYVHRRHRAGQCLSDVLLLPPVSALVFRGRRPAGPWWPPCRSPCSGRPTPLRLGVRHFQIVRRSSRATAITVTTIMIGVMGRTVVAFRCRGGLQLGPFSSRSDIGDVDGRATASTPTGRPVPVTNARSRARTWPK